MCRRKKNKYPVADNIVRAPGGMQPTQPQSGPFPKAQQAAQTLQMPNCGRLPVMGNGMPMGLPTYTSVDEYGRTFNPLVHYGPQTHSAPVPVAIAPEICQMNPIVSPVAFVPYAGQQTEIVTEEQR